MKTNILKLSILFIFTGFLSCQKEQKTEILTSHSTELRSINWCDGSETDPPAVFIYGFFEGTGADEGKCCYKLRFPTAYAGKNFKVYTTDWNFSTMSGNPGDNHQYPFAGGNPVTICFPQQGSHFLIEMLDGNGQPISCNTFVNLCED